MKKVQHEKLKVLRPCLNDCDNLLREGAILEYRRMDESDKDHQDGAPDIEVRVIKDDIVWLLMFECKRPDGKGVHRDKQKIYRDKYANCKNVIYTLVIDVSQVKATVERVTGFYGNKLKSIDL